MQDSPRVSSSSHYTKYICTRFSLSYHFILKLWFSQMKEWKSTMCYSGLVYWTIGCDFSEAVTLSCFQPTGQHLGLRSCSVPLPAVLCVVITLICASSTPKTQVAYWEQELCVSADMPLKDSWLDPSETLRSTFKVNAATHFFMVTHFFMKDPWVLERNCALNRK